MRPELTLSDRKLQEYQDRVQAGIRSAANQRVVICGLARDLEWILPETLRRFESLGEMFADYRIVIYENDSIDRSPEILEEFRQQNARVHLLSESFGDPPHRSIRCFDRVERMAKYRNWYREYIAENFADFDRAIIVDMDLPSGWSESGIAHTMGHTDWDFVGSNGLIRKRYVIGERLLQFDAWAFRTYGSYQVLSTREVNYKRWNLEEGFVPVYSCFGGLGIYRMKAMLTCSYKGGDCEHVPFHQQMREQGMTNLFLNPFQTTDYGIKYSRARRWLNMTGCWLLHRMRGLNQIDNIPTLVPEPGGIGLTSCVSNKRPSRAA